MFNYDEDFIYKDSIYKVVKMLSNGCIGEGPDGKQSIFRISKSGIVEKLTLPVEISTDYSEEEKVVHWYSERVKGEYYHKGKRTNKELSFNSYMWSYKPIDYNPNILYLFGLHHYPTEISQYGLSVERKVVSNYQEILSLEINNWETLKKLCGPGHVFKTKIRKKEYIKIGCSLYIYKDSFSKIIFTRKIHKVNPSTTKLKNYAEELSLKELSSYLDDIGANKLIGRCLW